MSIPGPTCFTTALPSDPGTLNPGHTLSPAERYQIGANEGENLPVSGKCEYVVRRGDTVAGIANRFHIRYWANIYFAPENIYFRDTHADPDLIYPGDRLQIPPAASIAPMERKPLQQYTDVPLFLQSAKTCWRATGNMLYNRHQGATGSAEFNRVIGPKYSSMTEGLRGQPLTDFYVSCLGMSEARITSLGELHFLVAQHGPVIVFIGDDDSAHAMVMAGFDLLKRRWLVLDPNARGAVVNFEDEDDDPHSASAPRSASPTRLPEGPLGRATWEDMHRWLKISETTVNALVYYYP